MREFLELLHALWVTIDAQLNIWRDIEYDAEYDKWFEKSKDE